MKETRLIMGMPITIAIQDSHVSKEIFAQVFAYFHSIDKRFSTYKKESEISRINKGRVSPKTYSRDMQTIFALSQKTKEETHGYFDIHHNGRLDPSGIVKGWAIYEAHKLLQRRGYRMFYIDAGGDIQVSGKEWKVGIRNPFTREEIVKVLTIANRGVATSGSYIRGQHVYNPLSKKPLNDIISITVIGPNVYEADRFATAAFAMQKKGIQFIESLKDFAGYMIDAKGIATYTRNFQAYVLS